MRLEQPKAVPHPDGNRIDISWINPDPQTYPYVRVVRQEGSFPPSPRVGVRVPQFSLAGEWQSVLDTTVPPSAALQQEFAAHKAPLSANAVIALIFADRQWRIHDGDHEYALCKRDDAALIDVYNDRLPFATDQPLHGETVYYYTLFPYTKQLPEPTSVPLSYAEDVRNRVAAMATNPYNMAGQLYDLLPAIYRRYDSVQVDPAVDAASAARQEPLRRFLTLPGAQLDQLYSFARALLALSNIEKVDGRLLPLLAEWIGWQTNYQLSFAAQRNALRNAPALYQTIGIIPTVEATIKSTLGWECRTKEFVHNILRTNTPERLTIWLQQRTADGAWSTPTHPLSLDDAYGDRVAACVDQKKVLWLFYQTQQSDQGTTSQKSAAHQHSSSPIKSEAEMAAESKEFLSWDLLYKPIFELPNSKALVNELNDSHLSPTLRGDFATRGFALSDQASVTKLATQDEQWLLLDPKQRATYTIALTQTGETLLVNGGSQPVVQRQGIEKGPTVVLFQDALWLFWHVFEPIQKRWRIDYRRYANGRWSAITTFRLPAEAKVDTPLPQRKRPWTIVDNAEPAGLWLFWLEETDTGWQLKYNRYDGAQWLSTNAIGFPDVVPIEDDLFVCLQPESAHPGKAQIGVFWTCLETIAVGTEGAKQTHWRLHYRIKTHLELNDQGWGEVHSLPELSESIVDYDDREPAVLVDEQRHLELFWSSNRGGNWAIWHGTLVVDGDKPSWQSPVAAITHTPYSQRTPLPLKLDGATLLIYRSNASITYHSMIYGATETLDARYAGSTTFDTRNVAKRALRSQYGDFQTYLYNTAKVTDSGQFTARRDARSLTGAQAAIVPAARDTVGIYLTPTTDDPTVIVRNQHLMEDVLRQFLPIQVRLFFIIEPALYTEQIYNDQHRLAEGVSATLSTSTPIDSYSGLTESPGEAILDWRWLHTWSQAYPKDQTVDTTLAPIDLKARIWHTGVKVGG